MTLDARIDDLERRIAALEARFAGPGSVGPVETTVTPSPTAPLSPATVSDVPTASPGG